MAILLDKYFSECFRRSSRYAMPPELHPSFPSVVASAARFEFDRDLATEDLYNFGRECVEQHVFPLPAASVIYEYDRRLSNGMVHRISMLAVLQNGQIIIGAIGALDGIVKTIGFSTVELTDDGKYQEFELYFGSPLWDDLTRDLMKEATCYFVAFTMSLKCRDVIVTEHKPSERVAKKREKRGQDPIAVYTTVRVKPELRSAYRNRADDFARTSPRLHFRRGHLRTLPNGKMTVVSPCYVGNSKAGVVVKDYEVGR